MAISSAIAGATVPMSELEGRDINALIDQGIISPREGGQSFEFLKGHTFGSTVSSTSPVSGFNLANASTEDLLKYTGTDTSGISASFDIAEDLLKQAQISSRAATTAQFAEERAKAEELGKAEVGVRTQQATRFAGGLGLDTAAQGYIQAAEENSKKRINELNRLEQQALAKADFDTATALADLQVKEQQSITDLRQQGFQNFLSLQTAQRGQTQLDISTINALQNIPEGQTVTIGGQTFTGLAKSEISPFFNGANIVSLMKSIPIGESQEIQDPNTGDVFTLTGLASDNPQTSTIQSTDPSGNVTITTIDKATGEIINQVRAGQIGKGFKDTTPEQTNEFQKDLLIEIEKLKKGDYKTEGSRERLIESLKSTARVKYPELEDVIDDMIYGSDEYEAILPDGYETLIGGGSSEVGNWENY